MLLPSTAHASVSIPKVQRKERIVSSFFFSFIFSRLGCFLFVGKYVAFRVWCDVSKQGKEGFCVYMFCCFFFFKKNFSQNGSNPFPPDLLHLARERYESAWIACVGSDSVAATDESSPKLPQWQAAAGSRVCELLYAWGNSYLLEALHCQPRSSNGKGAERLLRAAVVKYREAIALSEGFRSPKVKERKETPFFFFHFLF